MKLKRTLAVVAFFLLEGCQSPIVDKRNVEYTLKYEINGEPHEFNAKFECRYQSPKLISEAGDRWVIESSSFNIVARDKLPDGSVVTIRPYEHSLISENTQAVGLSTMCEQWVQKILLHINSGNEIVEIPFQTAPQEIAHLKGGEIHFSSVSLTGKKDWAFYNGD